MAANTFATMLHKSSPKMGVLLVYSLLEWVLIALLLLNALFSYLISRFANYFGLKPPCLLCSRVDHLFEHAGAPKKSYTDFLCNEHVAEISRLGFCSRHQKVPEGSGGFCAECCSECGSESPHHAEVELKCCCCGASLDFETSDDEGFVDPLSNQLTVTFRDEDGGHREVREGAVIIILDEDEEDGEDRQNHDKEERDEVAVEGQGEEDVDATSKRDVDATEEGDVNATGEREADDMVSVAPSQSSDQYRRVYGADFYVKLVSQCRACGTIMEENLVSDAPLQLSPDDLPGPSLVGEASVEQKDAFDSSLVFFLTREIGDATADCSLVSAADIFFDNQVWHCPKSLSPEEVHLISVDNIATNEETVVSKEIHIAAASEDFDQIGCETNLKRVSVSEGISEQKPVQVVHALDCITRSTEFCIETEDKSQDSEEDNETDGDVSIKADATEDHIYGIQNPDLLQPLLDHISDDNGKADSEKSCEVSIGSEICEQEHPLVLQVHESHTSLVYQDEIELKHAIDEGDEGTEQNGDIGNIDSQKGSFIHDTFPPLISHHILATATDPVISEERHRDDIREDSGMQKDHQHCHWEMMQSSQASVLESDVIEVQEHKEIHPTHPSLAIQISQSSEINNGDLRTKSGDSITSEVHDQTVNAKAVTEGHRLPGSDIQNTVMEFSGTVAHDIRQHPLDAESAPMMSLHLEKSTGLKHEMRSENQGDEVAFEGSGNIRIETSCETPGQNQLNAGEIEDSCKFQEGSKETAEEIPTREVYSQIEIGSPAANHIEISPTMDHLENHHSHAHTEDNEMDEEKAPETPQSEEGIQSFHARLVFDKRDHTTESVDGSVASEMDGGEPLTLEHLKAALKAERNALRSLYAELEEERSASAIAANQTMAMITRLQEEKASMQMEALQYQRMMEEQTEYDQEALQMLNELVMKREKEKQELEHELEMYREKLEHYEAKKRRRSSGKAVNMQNGFDSGLSDGDDSDGHSYNSDDEEQDMYDAHKKHKTSAEVMLHSTIDEEAVKNLISLDESLDDFEEERRSILVQLKELEEKLYVSEDDVGSSRKSKHTNEFADEQMDMQDETEEMQNSIMTGFSSGLSDELVSNEKEPSRRHLLSGGKRLLPLFDAAASDDVEGSQKEQDEAIDGSPASASKSDTKLDKVVIAEEVEHVYDRLLALEADREFLKHCIRSLKNGDKGIKLLQEILQHLHDLKHAELLRSSDVGSGSPSDLNLES